MRSSAGVTSGYIVIALHCEENGWGYEVQLGLIFGKTPGISGVKKRESKSPEAWMTRALNEIAATIVKRAGVGS